MDDRSIHTGQIRSYRFGRMIFEKDGPSGTSYLYSPCGVDKMHIMYNLIMHNLSEIQQILRGQKTYLEEKYGVKVIGVFGSYVRNEQRPDSDLDLLIELDEPPKITLIGLVELEDYLSQLLGVEVDLAIKKNLKKRIGVRILQEVVPI